MEPRSVCVLSDAQAAATGARGGQSARALIRPHALEKSKRFSIFLNIIITVNLDNTLDLTFRLESVCYLSLCDVTRHPHGYFGRQL